MNFSENMPAIIAVAVAVILLLAILVVVKPIRNFFDRLRLTRAIKRLGTASMSNVVLSDGMDGHVFIEHLVLTPRQVLVVSVRRYSGTIFAAENMDMWAQMTDGGSYKFPNPLHEIETAIAAVKSHLPDAAVAGIDHSVRPGQHLSQGQAGRRHAYQRDCETPCSKPGHGDFRAPQKGLGSPARAQTIGLRSGRSPPLPACAGRRIGLRLHQRTGLTSRRGTKRVASSAWLTGGCWPNGNKRRLYQELGRGIPGTGHELLQSFASEKQWGDARLLQIIRSWRRAAQMGMAPRDTQAVTDRRVA